jgi:hypothetical protein
MFDLSLFETFRRVFDLSLSECPYLKLRTMLTCPMLIC